MLKQQRTSLMATWVEMSLLNYQHINSTTSHKEVKSSHSVLNAFMCRFIRMKLAGITMSIFLQQWKEEHMQLWNVLAESVNVWSIQVLNSKHLNVRYAHSTERTKGVKQQREKIKVPFKYFTKSSVSPTIPTNYHGTWLVHLLYYWSCNYICRYYLMQTKHLLLLL